MIHMMRWGGLRSNHRGGAKSQSRPEGPLTAPSAGLPDQTVSLFVCVLNQPSKHADLIVFKRGKVYIIAGVEPAAGQEEREEAIEASSS